MAPICLSESLGIYKTVDVKVRTRSQIKYKLKISGMEFFKYASHNSGQGEGRRKVDSGRKVGPDLRKTNRMTRIVLEK